jgi:hypothetical protein
MIKKYTYKSEPAKQGQIRELVLKRRSTAELMPVRTGRSRVSIMGIVLLLLAIRKRSKSINSPGRQLIIILIK